MSNKTQLQTNNTNLDALIMRVNAAKDTAASLPEAGEGGGTALEFVTITYNSLPAPGMIVYYLDESLTLQSCAPTKGYSFSALKNSILIVIEGLNNSFPSCTYITGSEYVSAFQVTG